MAKHKGNCGRIFDETAYTEDELDQIGSLIHFDPVFYLNEYADVASNGIDPLRHYLSLGIDEGRLPAALQAAAGQPSLAEAIGFDEAFYRAEYPDVVTEPFLHFISCGARERRLPFKIWENLASERSAERVLKRLGITLEQPLEAQMQFEPEPWLPVPAALEAALAQSGVTPKPYRNNYWLAMAVGLLARGRLGAAACCYNFFFNYYVPIERVGNDVPETFGTGRIVHTAGMLAQQADATLLKDVDRQVSSPEPVFLNRPASGKVASWIDLPRPVYGVLTEVEAISGSSLMVQGGHRVLYDYAETGARAREMQCPNLLHLLGEYCSFRLPTRTVEVNEAFSLLHDHGHNYHHWLLEVLPRYLLARREGLPATVPVLINEPVTPQFREILEQASLGQPPIVEIPRRASARVKRLHWISDLCVNNVHTNRPPSPSDILFSPTAVELLRDLAAPHFATTPGRYDRVLIARNNVGFRRLVNAGVLHTALEQLGCWSFDPGQASWAEQVRVFSNARLIVAEAGAALANIVFCQPGATIIVLVNGHPNSNFYYLAQLAGLVGCRLLLFECLRLVDTHEIGVQDDMIVPLEELCRWVRQLLAEDGELPRSDQGSVVSAAAKGQGASRQSRRGRQG